MRHVLLQFRRRAFVKLSPKGSRSRAGNLTACPAKPWRSRGFTLIELLVVIVIIGVLVSMVIINLNSVRVKSRDVRRVSDIRQIQQALELYNNENGGYPGALTPGNSLVSPISGNTFLKIIPSDPNVAESGQQYTYTPVGTTNYTLTYGLVKGVEEVGPGSHTAIANNLSISGASCHDYGSYYEPITVSNASASTLTNQQIMLVVNTAVPIAAGKMSADGHELRVTNSDCSVEYSFWLEPGTINSTLTNLYVKFPSLPAGGSDTIRLHYGKTALADASSGANTFIYFDNSGTAGSYNMGSQLDYFVEGHTNASSLVIGAFGESSAFHNHYRLWMPWSADSRIGSVVADVETARLTSKPLWTNYRFKLIVEQQGASGNTAIFWLYNRDLGAVSFNDSFPGYLTLNSSNNWFYHPAWPWVAIGKYDDTLSSQPTASYGAEISE